MILKKVVDVISTLVKPTVHQTTESHGILGLGSRKQLETQRKLHIMHGALIMGDVETASRIRSELNLPHLTGPL